jgi:streptogramin lyase
MRRRQISLKAHHRATVVILFLAAIASNPFVMEAQNTSTVAGVVKSAAGEPVAGAYVKLSSASLGVAYIVVSQAQGRFSTPNLLPGKYTIQSFGGDRQSKLSEPVEVTKGQSAKMDLILSAPRNAAPRRKRMTEAEYESLMPNFLRSRCIMCHGLEPVAAIRAARPEWLSTVEKMRSYMQEIGVTFSDRERDEMVDYFAKNFGPGAPPFGETSAPDPNINLPAALAKGAESKYVAMEFNLSRGARPHDIAVDSQGVAWVSERSTNMFGRFDPKSLSYTRVALPPGKFSETGLNAIAVDPHDGVWAMDNGPNNRLVQYNAKSREFNIYPVPAPPDSGGSAINTIRFFPDGSVWGSGIVSSRILKLDPITRKVTDYPVPKGSHPYGMAIGGDKMIWYVSNYGNEVVRLNPGTGELTRYPAPTPHSDLRRMAADADGNLWAGAHDAGKLLKADYRTSKLTEYGPPTEDSGPYSIDVDMKRNRIWFSEHYADKIGWFDPRTNSFAEFPLPSPDLDVRRIEIDRSHPNRVWWSGWLADKIGYIEVME